MQAGDRPTVDQLRRDATKGLLAFLPTAASKVAAQHGKDHDGDKAVAKRLRRTRRAEAAGKKSADSNAGGAAGGSRQQRQKRQPPKRKKQESEESEEEADSDSSSNSSRDEDEAAGNSDDMDDAAAAAAAAATNGRSKRAEAGPAVGAPGQAGMASETATMRLGADEMIYGFKIVPCSRRVQHDWTACFFLHKGERARRRDLRTHQYAAVMCCDMLHKGSCAKGDACEDCHNVFEYHMHPANFRTKMCHDGANCTRAFCFFAHSLDELRLAAPVTVTIGNPQDKQQQQQQQQQQPVNTCSSTSTGMQLQQQQVVQQQQQQQELQRRIEHLEAVAMAAVNELSVLQQAADGMPAAPAAKV
ncbi:hypothetical protein OEZ85_012254 [Tetradesmus obliquus]|uniref:AtC3H23-like CCCH zinc finger domain-containing protein n=1 Tax=Tetradesmus obliquus TaxID=3088 RepID=A0ABY8TXI9_TETOB|nr:hypothetical protein OEZ85_012254 [Tetradesmus obliquus]